MRGSGPTAGAPVAVAPLPSRGLPRCVQFSVARSVQFSMAIDTGIVKSKLRADPVRQRRPVGELLPPHHGVQTIQLSAQGALDLVLNYHVVETTTGILICPALFVGIGQS